LASIINLNASRKYNYPLKIKIRFGEKDSLAIKSQSKYAQIITPLKIKFEKTTFVKNYLKLNIEKTNIIN
jgi:hypothetical protein